MNNGTSLSSVVPTSSVVATASASATSSWSRTPRTSDGFLNATVGPSVYRTESVPNAWFCTGNVYAATQQCCSRLGGTPNASSYTCDADCCDMFARVLPTCPYGAYKYPTCVLPAHMNHTDWSACYRPLAAGVNNAMWGCQPPSGARATVAPPVAAVLLLVAAVALGVLSM